MPDRNEQKAVVVHAAAPAETGLTEVPALTAELNDGWRIVSTAPMGGAGDGAAPRFATLVILERDPERTVSGFGR